MAQGVDPNSYTYPFQLTRAIHRDPYPFLSPDAPGNFQKGKIIVITGGGSGIGKAAARVWARAGATGVVIAGRRLNNLQKVVEELLSYKETKVLALKTDITLDRDVKNLFDQVQNTFGRPADVVLANAGIPENENKIGNQDTKEWWNRYTINMKGLFLTMHYYINSLPNPQDPVGTFITVNSSLAGVITPGHSGYSTAKLAGQRLVEFSDTEYPNLRAFTTVPGVVAVESFPKDHPFYSFAKDHPDLTGMLALYLAQPKADWLRGQFVSVNWDIEEMLEHKEGLLQKNALRLAWLPILPASGGTGLSSS